MTEPPPDGSITIPAYDGSVVVVAAPGAGPGNWSGAPSAVLDDGTFWLAYRMRRPLDEGRGVAVLLARSADGASFETVGRITRDQFGAASLERPALVRRPDGGWRLYVSCASQASKHWWISALDAPTVAGLVDADPVTVLPGDATTGVKDPVVQVRCGRWRMWVCCHPLGDPGHEDRMTTRLADSDDGLTWELGPTVLRPSGEGWDARGTRVTAVLPGDPQVALYDGRASAEENWYERTGVAVAGPDGVFVAAPDGPAAESPYARHALRYASVVALPEGGHRIYFEAARADGAHDLRTSLADGVRPG